MESISRRGFVLSATTAAAAFGLDGPLEFISPAHAQKAAGKPPITDIGYVKFKVGDIEVTQLYDGWWERPHDPGFVKNASVDDVKGALKAGGHTTDFVPIPFTVTVIKSKGQYLMFDSSTGGQLSPKAGLVLSRNMYAAGISPADIKTIAVTHFHMDHISGMMGKETNAQVFPDAEIAVPAAEYKYWTDPALIEKLPEANRGAPRRIQATFPKWKNVRQIEDGKEVIPGVRVVSMPGHTPGHTGYVVSSGKKQLINSGDIVNMPALFVKNIDWQVAFDADPATAAATKRLIIDRAVADKAMIAGYHWGLPGAGTIVKDGKGYTFVPVKT